MDHKEFLSKIGKSRSPKKLAAIRENCKKPRFSRRAILTHLDGLLDELEDFEGMTPAEVKEQGKATNEAYGRWSALSSLMGDIKNNRIKR